MINPEEPSLQAEIQSGSDSSERLPARIERYSKAKARALQMQGFLYVSGERGLSGLVRNCGNWLIFNHYYTVDKVRLAKASFCKKHLLCPLCAIRRGAKQLKAYLDRFQVITSQNQGLRASMVTLTVKNGIDLSERLDHLREGLKKLNSRRRQSKAGRNMSSEWSKVLGLVGTYEVTRNQETEEWHPHCHIIVLHREDIVESALAHEWLCITGDSFVLDVTPLEHPEEPARDFVEVFKYAVKFSELSLDDNLKAFRILHGRRLIFSAGLFRGVEVPEDLTDELPEDLPYIKLFYRFIEGSGYNLGSITKTKGRPFKGTN